MAGPLSKLLLLVPVLLTAAGCAEESEGQKALRHQAVADLMVIVEEDEHVLELVEYEVERVSAGVTNGRAEILVRTIRTPYVLGRKIRRDMQQWCRSRFVVDYRREGERWERVEYRFDFLGTSEVPPSERVAVPAAILEHDRRKARTVEIVVQVEEKSYRFEGKNTESLLTLRQWVAAAKKRAEDGKKPVEGRIRAGHDVGIARVMKVVKVLKQELGIDGVGLQFSPDTTDRALPFPDDK